MAPVDHPKAEPSDLRAKRNYYSCKQKFDIFAIKVFFSNFEGSQMHLGKFHHTITTLTGEYGRNAIQENLDLLVARLTELATNPGNTEIAQTFKTQLEKVRASLERATLNHPHPTMKAMIESIGADEFVGDKLFDRIEHELEANQMTPAIAVESLRKLSTEVTDFYKQIASIDSAFSKLHVEYEEIEPGEGEIGIIIPTPPEDRLLLDLAKTAKAWNTALAPFVELYDPENHPIVVRTIASSDWQFYLNAAVPVLAGISFCISQMNGLLEKLIETKKLAQQLLGKGIPEAAVAPIIAAADEGIKFETRALAEKIVDEAPVHQDDGRTNELKNAITQSLKFIAQEIAANVVVEIRYLPPDPVTAEDPEIRTSEEIAESAEVARLTEIANQITRNMDLVRLEHDAAFRLNLPPPDNQDV